MDQKYQPPHPSGLPLIRRLKTEIKVLAVLAGPIVVTQLLQVAVGVLDTVMAGRASTKDLAGVTVGVSLWVPAFIFSLGLLMALTPIVAHAKGAREEEHIAPAVHQAFYIALIIGSLIFILFLNIDQILEWLNINTDIRSVASGYLYAMSFGMPALVGFGLLRAYAEGLSLTRPAMVSSIISLLVNAPLNYILIYGKLGFPALGGVGCGWASAAALWVSFFVMAWHVIFSKNFHSIGLFKRLYAPHWPQIKSLLKLGLPIGCNFLFEAGLFTVIALLLTAYGAAVVASHQIVINIISLTITIPFSLCFSLTIRVGFFLGAEHLSAARFSSVVGIGLTLTCGAFSCIFLSIFASSIVAIYTPEIKTQLLAVNFLMFAAIYQVLYSIQLICIGALRGYKDTTVSMLITMVAFWLLSLPVGYSLAMTDWISSGQQAEGFWIGLIFGQTIAAICLSIRLYYISRRKLFTPLTTCCFNV